MNCEHFVSIECYKRGKNNALGAIRTRDLSLKRGVLYLLSYKRKNTIQFNTLGVNRQNFLNFICQTSLNSRRLIAVLQSHSPFMLYLAYSASPQEKSNRNIIHCQ